MSNVAKLKKQAAEFEAKKQFDKALAIYVKVLEAYDQFPEEVDLALFNRVGDLQLRQGNVADAVDYYERAVDKYAEGGFFNNAIALCNKILRQSPGRASVYYKLGKISAQKGFKADAKQNFLEYAERMQKSGNMNEAFRALKEFADLCPDQDDIRLMLADQLTKLGRKDEAVEQAQTLHERYESDGRSAEAIATANRLRAIDPAIEPRSSRGQRKAASDDLIFIDLGDPPARTSRSQRAIVDVPEIPPPPPAMPTPSVSQTAASMSAVTPISSPAVSSDPIFLDLSEPTPPSVPALDVEPTAMLGASANLDTPSGGLLDLEVSGVDLGGGLDPTPLQPIEFEPTSLTPESVPVLSATPVSSAAPVEFADSVLADPPMIDLGEPSTHVLEFEPVESVEPIEVVEPVEPIEVVEPVEPIGVVEPVEPIGVIEPTEVVEVVAVVKAVEPPSLAGLDVLDVESDKGPVVESGNRPVVESGNATVAEPGDAPVTETEAAPSDPELALPRRLTLTPRTSARAVVGLPIMDLDTPLSTPSVSAPATPEERIPDAHSGTAGSELVMLSMDEETESQDDASVGIPTPAGRSSTLFAAQSVHLLEAAVAAEPRDWSLRRELAEAMLEAGDRTGGIAQLEEAMQGAEDSNDLSLAGSLADELVRLEPDVVRHHQKRVEFAFRRNDRGRLVEAYLALAEVLLRSDQSEKARIVYERVLNLDPAEARARLGIESLPAPEPPPPPPEPKRPAARTSTARTPAVAPPEAPVSTASSDFVNLGDWLRDDEAPKDTRMVVEEKEPTGDENADFADMLAKFKQGVAANVDAEDYQSHYDLAIAYKEMGLIDEAISGFQRALGGPGNRLPTYEALGHCFIEKAQYRMASSILQRALSEKGASDEQLVGVLYLLGRASEELGKRDDAVEYYQRVFVIDIQFKDVADRLANVERAGR